MATIYKEVTYPLSKLIEDIDMGEVALPELQRPFVWSNAKVRNLFDSMYRGYPIGYLLFWESMPSSNVSTRNIGENKKQKRARLLVVDGQQRLTALFTVMKGTLVKRESFKEERIQIAFSPKDERFEVADAAVIKNHEYIPDITELWKDGVSPNRFAKDFISKLSKHRQICSEEEDSIHDSISNLVNLKSYPFIALELSPEVSEEQVAEVFVRINSQGKALNQSDFILTLMSVFWEDGRKKLEEFCGLTRTPSTSINSPFNFIINPNPEDLLRVSIGKGFKRGRLKYAYLILRGKDLETEKFSDELRDSQFKVLIDAQNSMLNLTNWHDFLKIPINIGLVSEKYISSKVNLLFTYTLYLIGKEDFSMDRAELRSILSRWLFMTALTGRYTGSPESLIERDLNEIKARSSKEGFIAYLEETISSKLTDDFWSITLPNDLSTSAARSPSLFAYYSALNILGAKALFSTIALRELMDPGVKSTRSSLEKHHLFPANYLKGIGFKSTRDRNQIANFALIEWNDNGVISDTKPSDYFPKIFARYSELEKKEQAYFHALPHNWYDLDYKDFLELRRKMIAIVIKDGFNKLK